MNNVIVTVKFTLSDKEYEGKLSSQAMLQCTVFANINEKDQHWVGKTTQQFALPQISFSFPGGSSNAKKGKYNWVIVLNIDAQRNYQEISQLHYYMHNTNCLVGKPFNVVAFFDNPLSTTLTNIEWIVEGAGLMKPDIVKNKE